MTIYRLWKEWFNRVKPEECSTKVREDFGDTSLPFDEWWNSHQRLFFEGGYLPNGNISDKKIEQITKALKVYDANTQYKKKRLLTNNLYEVGIEAGINEENTPKPTDGEILAKKKRAKLTAEVARYLKTAECIRHYVAKGVFPKTTYEKGDQPPPLEERSPRIHDWLIR